MSKRATLIEWQVSEDERAWNELAQQPSPTGPIRRSVPAWVGEKLCLLLLVSSVAIWYWYTAQITAKQSNTHSQSQAHPQTRADLANLGPERSLETPSITFTFRQSDATAVIAAAPQVEAIYTAMQRNFGLSSKTGEQKLAVDVSVTQAPGQIYFAIRRSEGPRALRDESMTQAPGQIYSAIPLPERPRTLRVASPSLYQAPVALTEAELLAQSIVLPMINDLLKEAADRHRIGLKWQPLMSSFELWQLWQLDLPLSNWRNELVQWVYVDLPTTRRGEAIPLPRRYTTLCAEHTLWMRSPQEIHLPFLCNNPGQAKEAYSSWEAYNPPLHLGELTAPFNPEYYPAAPTKRVIYGGQLIALTTLVDYAVATYGRERLPVLIRNLGQFDNWETLIPAVYDVSATEFEAGWQNYLAAYDAEIANRLTYPEIPFHSQSPVRQSVNILDKKEP